ncbi:hypothetical protein AB0958_21995 [Streptomyces sp. NPDC006655]|uniref:hypothetical protein n=1 Tax=Streptomyces sp. NPDC006655 TaxID=3156898 RepID=UPI003452DD0D
MSITSGRYAVIQKGKGPYGIWDHTLRDWCTLAVGYAIVEHMPLEWRTASEAREWLMRCRMAWLWNQAPMPEGAGAMLREVPTVNERGERDMTFEWE